MKRFLSLLLALAMMFTLVACGGGNGANSDGSDAGVPDTIKIGVMGTMTGEQALAYARLRAIDNDYERTARQRRVLLAIARKVKTLSFGDLTRLIATCLNYVETDLTLADIITLARAGLGADLDAIEELRLPVDGTYTSGKMPENGLWVIQPDFEANAQALHAFIYGTAAE